MKYFLTIFSIADIFILPGCSKSSLEQMDLEAIKKKAVDKKEYLKDIQEKIKKIKKKL